MIANRKRAREQNRRGAVVVEFAIIAPVITVVIIGLCEMGQAMCGATKIASAIREGGRLASMDFSGKLEAGQTANEKVEQDVLNFLAATGVRIENAQVEILHAEGDSVGQEFDLASAENYLQLFTIQVTVPYENVSVTPVSRMYGRSITSSITFRRGRTPISSGSEA